MIGEKESSKEAGAPAEIGENCEYNKRLPGGIWACRIYDVGPETKIKECHPKAPGCEAFLFKRSLRKQGLFKIERLV